MQGCRRIAGLDNGRVTRRPASDHVSIPETLKPIGELAAGHHGALPVTGVRHLSSVMNGSRFPAMQGNNCAGERERPMNWSCLRFSDESKQQQERMGQLLWRVFRCVRAGKAVD